MTDVVDPLAGSYYVESLTNELVEKAWALMEEVEEMGGSQGGRQRNAQASHRRSAVRRQAMIDKGDEVIVGVNNKEQEDPIDILDVDNVAVREAQVARLERIRATRDEAVSEAALEALTTTAREGGNPLAAAVEPPAPAHP